MPLIHVCPLRSVAETVAATKATHLVSMLSPWSTPPATPHGIADRFHLKLTFHDITTPSAGHIAPSEEHVAAILGFAERWPRTAPIVVHCHAGISRSTAAAYMIACALDPDGREDQIAAELRAASPTATPNSLMNALADARLGRSGRMIRAIQAIGRGENGFEGVPFALRIGNSRR
jgi:predicted protein tyrosine phosphatase